MQAPSLEGLRERFRDAEADRSFWAEHFAEFATIHPEQFVAVLNGAVVAVAKDLSQLIALLEGRHLDVTKTSVRFVTLDPSKYLR